MRPVPMKSALMAVALAAVLSACGSNPYSLPDVTTGEPDYRDSEGQSAPVVPSVPPRQADPGATAAAGPHRELLAMAVSARGQGRYDQALAYLERAQRIDPDDAEVYLAMARTHDAAGNAGQAKATAERGLLYCMNSAQCNALRTYAD